MTTSRRTPARGRTAAGPRRSPPRRATPGRESVGRAGATRAVETAERPRRGRFTGRAAVSVLLLLVLVISYASSLRAWLQQRAEITTARADITQTQVSVDALERAKLRWQDPVYVQQQARERFGWLVPGEVGYRVIGADGSTLGAPPAPSAPSAPAPDWYVTVWDSVRAAGEPPPQVNGPAPLRNDVIAPPARHGSGQRTHQQ